MATAFDYKIITQNNVSVVTFRGRISRVTKDQLESCRQQILAEASEYIIFYFKDVPAVEPAVFREFTLLQQDIRKKNVPLFLTGLDTATKQYLLERAVIRMSELRKSLQEIFDELAKPDKK